MIPSPTSLRQVCGRLVSPSQTRRPLVQGPTSLPFLHLFLHPVLLKSNTITKSLFLFSDVIVSYPSRPPILWTESFPWTPDLDSPVNTSVVLSLRFTHEYSTLPRNVWTSCLSTGTDFTVPSCPAPPPPHTNERLHCLDRPRPDVSRTFQYYVLNLN